MNQNNSFIKRQQLSLLCEKSGAIALTVPGLMAVHWADKIHSAKFRNTYVTRPAKTRHVGTFKYLRNTNLKYSVPHNSPVPD